MLSHDGVKPHQCDIPGCGKCFKDIRSLKRHKETKHSTNENKFSGQLQYTIPNISHSLIGHPIGHPITSVSAPIAISYPIHQISTIPLEGSVQNADSIAHEIERDFN